MPSGCRKSFCNLASRGDERTMMPFWSQKGNSRGERIMKKTISISIVVAVLLMAFAYAQENPAAKPAVGKPAAAAAAKQGTVRLALSAAPGPIAKNATVKDWSGNTLKQGGNDYTCYPPPPDMHGIGPMCFDKVWQSWADAWMNKKDFKADGIGIAYMLQGDAGASNTDPYAMQKTAYKQCVQTGPHTIVVVHVKSALDALPLYP